jgi:hypothetical protein
MVKRMMQRGKRQNREKAQERDLPHGRLKSGDHLSRENRHSSKTVSATPYVACYLSELRCGRWASPLFQVVVKRQSG